MGICVIKKKKKIKFENFRFKSPIRPKFTINEKYKKEISIIETNKDKINQYKDFNYKFKKPEIKKKDLPQGQHTSTCIICNYTCHYPCYIPDNRCSAIRNEKFTICEKKCVFKKIVQMKNLEKNMLILKVIKLLLNKY